MSGSVLIVHGTGVRSADYKTSFAASCAVAKEAGLDASFHECLWGDPLGIDFKGLSLPDPPDEATLRAADAEDESWAWRFENPLLELEQMAISAVENELTYVFNPQSWRTEFEKIVAYIPSLDLQALLAREQLAPYWNLSWQELISEPIVASAFEQSQAAGELPDCKQALARAAVAVLHNQATIQGRSGPTASLRAKLVVRLSDDWGQVYGLGTRLADLLARAATAGLRKHRNPLNSMIAAAVGDILLYQLHGARIRSFIESKLAQLPPPVTIVSHSLGGIACVDLLGMANAPKIGHLVTLGSQAPYFYEIGALAALESPAQLPGDFPPWLNLYDRNDFLSFVGSRVFDGFICDKEVRSGQPFPASHSSYLTSEEVWTAIKVFRGA